MKPIGHWFTVASSGVKFWARLDQIITVHMGIHSPASIVMPTGAIEVRETPDEIVKILEG